MDEQKTKNAKWVKTITNFAQMRFTPQRILNKQTKNANNKLVDRIKSFVPWPPVTRSSSKKTEEETLAETDPPEQARPQLKYARRLTAEHVLIGNQNQLDLISVHSATLTFLQTEYVWSMNPDYPIDYLSIDSKSNWCPILGGIIAVGSKELKKISVFRYE